MKAKEALTLTEQDLQFEVSKTEEYKSVIVLIKEAAKEKKYTKRLYIVDKRIISKLEEDGYEISLCGVTSDHGAGTYDIGWR